ncbi:histidine kinase [Hymenobacter sp. BT770]|uniref:sensor histidine kinase n=1 Tax=Hymenobacter sp. BT770 TaxID=2886942 RepID=UPI001D12E20A|nr:histidine kinase [Hymenobacter sp. BT770]MCC3153585.1 histidine kinase [Hymenobacter sp. BT770]MDO3415821.1 histidine kinase [Hymenobacter sp. BT770]
MYYTSKDVSGRLWEALATAWAAASRFTRYGIVAIAGCLLVTLLLILVDQEHGELSLFISLLVIHGFALHGYCFYYLIPRLESQGKGFRSYLLRFVGVLVVSSAVLFTVGLVLTQDPDASTNFGLLNAFFHLVVTGPLSWVLYKRQARHTQQIAVLETELGQTTANLDFLRSQINPHFLFNALNTLYGMALQENSERTAQGVQMLGDMMRFMLHENHQPRIMLAREVEYLQNYIALQELRTAASPNITIATTLADVQTDLQIAPMLLIPFVENAFKHGISLQHKSWITLTLECRQNTLYFDLHNSTHAKPTPDAASTASGVGLENVRQRLALLYPGRHELVIRQTAGEYFVHLTLQL